MQRAQMEAEASRHATAQAAPHKQAKVEDPHVVPMSPFTEAEKADMDAAAAQFLSRAHPPTSYGPGGASTALGAPPAPRLRPPIAASPVHTEQPTPDSWPLRGGQSPILHQLDISQRSRRPSSRPRNLYRRT